jgi:hypothetical protein
MKYTSHKMLAALAALVFLISHFPVSLNGQTPTLEAPEVELIDIEGMGLGFDNILPLYIFNYQAGEVEFNLYSKQIDNDGPFYLTDFEYFLETNNERPDIHVFLPFLEANDTYEFYLTAVNSEGVESTPSEILISRIGEYNEKEKFELSISDPKDGKGTVGEKYSFEVELLDSESRQPIEFIVVEQPENSDINGKTITFTPEKRGTFGFSFQASDTDTYSQMIVNYQVIIKQCKEETSLEITVNDQDGEKYGYGIIDLYPESVLDNLLDYEFGHRDLDLSAEVIDGQAFIDGLDEGKYYYAVNVKGGDPTFIDFKIDENGRPIIANREDLPYIQIQCGNENSEIAVINRAFSKETFTINGTVTLEDILDRKFTPVVTAYGYNEDQNRYFHFSSNVNNGIFELNLPIDLTYTVIAEAYGVDEVRGIDLLLRQYWKDATTRIDATTINQNFAGSMDFILRKPEPFANSISGMVSTEEGNTVNTDVFAFLIEENPDYERDTYMGRYEGIPTQTNDNGRYEITNLLPGKYVVMAIPYSEDYMHGFYSFSGAEMQWDKASILEITENSNVANIDITLTKKGVRSGKGIIRGQVDSNGDAKEEMSKQESTGKSGVTVYAIHQATGQSYNDMTNNRGQFQIDDLPIGKYSLTADKIGYLADGMIVTIEEEDSVVESDMYITTEVSSVNDNDSEYFQIFPNPSADRITVNIDENSEEYQISIVDLNGNVIFISDSITASTFDVDISTYPVGNYILRIEQDYGKPYFQVFSKR